MSEKTLVKSVKVTTIRNQIEEKRTRLINDTTTKYRKIWWQTPSRSDWARETYGETLKERTAEQIYNENKFNIPSKTYCQICGEEYGLDEEHIILTFNFCDEYNCGMTIHKQCPKII